MRVAVVTPYHKEPRPWLERCIASVRAQTHPGVEHWLVADGHPQPWIESAGVRHLRLDRAHGDYGNTPRAVGGLLAASEGADAVSFLDADNWYAPDHVASCVAVAAARPVDGVVALRHLARDDGSVLPIGLAEDIAGSHVDTSCHFLCRGAFHALARWALMPRPMAAVGDRFFLRSLHEDGLVVGRTGRKTVYYLCTWADCFRLAGEEPPPYAKAAIDARPVAAWIDGLDDRETRIVRRLAGVTLAPGAALGA